MKIMTETNDGFIISEKDLVLRGPGELFGLRQHGLPEFKIADLTRHMNILSLAQSDAKEIIENPEHNLESNPDKILSKIKAKFENQIESIALN